MSVSLKNPPPEPEIRQSAAANPFIPFAIPDIGEEEIQEVVDVLRSGWITTGRRAASFEQEFQDYVHAPHALAVNSCTSGLHLALVALGVGPGDEVITTPLTFCATVNVILQTGATPVLADIGRDLNIDPSAISAAITPRTRAILPVHIAGLPCDMEAIWSLARRHNLSVVEDAAHAVGSVHRGTPIGGGSSDATVFSFYATKNLTTGEGGMVTTSSESLHSRMKMLCLHGMSRDAWNRYGKEGDWYYEVQEPGFKYNLSDILAAMGLHQLRRLDRMNQRRREIVARYNQAFRDLEQLQIPPDRDGDIHAWHLYILRLNLDRLDIDRAQFFKEMRALGIGCSVHFIPIPVHPFYRRALPEADCPQAMREYPRLLSLPLYSGMSDSDVERVIAAVSDIASRCRKQFAAVGAAPADA